MTLLELTDAGWQRPGLRLCYARLDDGKLLRLAGRSPPIHELNAAAPIRLTEHNVLDYVRFFGFFVRGEHGPFYVVESADDPLLPDDPGR